MTLAELQAVIPELNAYQIDQITAQVVKYLNLNEELKNTVLLYAHVVGNRMSSLSRRAFRQGNSGISARGVEGNSLMTRSKSLHIPISPSIHG